MSIEQVRIKTNDTKKMWWNFTEERKKFRAKNGYPTNRPQKAWFETIGFERNDIH